MSRSWSHARLATATLLVAAAACSDGAPPSGPSGNDAAALNADVAVATGASIASDVAVWMGNEASVGSGFGPGGGRGSPTCTRNGSVTTCTGGRDGALDVTRTVTFFDATGSTQQQFDASTTARIDFGVQVSGSISGPQHTATVTRTSATSVTGLAGSETQRTWNGHGGSSMHEVFTGANGTRTHEMVTTDTTTDVVWVVAPARAAYPASGTVTRTIAVNTALTGTRNATFKAVRRVEVTFNGTAQVPMTVSSVTPRGRTVALTCQLDLQARTVSCAE